MKIVQQTPTQLTLKDNNYVLVLLGVVFIVVGFYNVFAFSSTSSRFVSNLLPGVFILLGIGAILLTTFDTVIFDKALGTVSFIHKGLVRKGSQDYPLSQITGIRLKTIYKMDVFRQKPGVTQTTPQLHYQIVLLMQNGEEVALDSFHGTESMINNIQLGGGEGNEQILAREIATFLSVPFQETQSNPPITLPLENQSPLITS